MKSLLVEFPIQKRKPKPEPLSSLSEATFIGCVDAWHKWVGVLVCGFRAFGLRKLRPQVELQSPMGQAEKLGYGAETKRQVGYGYDTFVMLSPPARTVKRPPCMWKGQTAPMKHLPEGAGSPISRMPQ